MKKSMIFFLLFTGLATCAVCQGKSVIPLKVERGKTLVTVHVGDHVIPDILLDTGFASDGLLIYNREYSDAFDLTGAKEINIHGAGSGEGSKALMIDSGSFSLGDIKMMNQRIIVLQSDTYEGFPSNGLIGYSIFGHYVTEFDYEQNKMTLHHAGEIKIDKSWTGLPIYFKDNKIPWVDISVVMEKEKPIELSAYIDYAAGDAVLLLEKPGMKFSLPQKTADAYLGRGLSGDIHGKTGTISKLIIGPYELKNVKASFAAAEVRSKQEHADAILGSASLKMFNLIFDYANEKLYLKPNKHFDDPFN